MVGTVTSADHGWFTVALTGQAQVRMNARCMDASRLRNTILSNGATDSFRAPSTQVRKCRRAEIQVIGESERAMPATTMATVAEKDEEEEKEEEEAIIRLDGSAAAKKSPPPVTQLQRGKMQC